jgi:cellulose synthase/poly-beta-1,6-N-acetylglucosamine synthase-like glycosyltransferase
MTDEFVSVIMPARNAAATIERSLSALLHGTYPADRVEIVVAEGSSTDGTRSILERLATAEPRLRIVDNPGGGTASGLNRALAVARGDVIVRLDAHTTAAPDYIARAVSALETTRADEVGGCLTLYGEGAWGEAIALAMSSAFGGGPAAFRQGGAGPVETVYLGCWRRTTLERFGGFDPDWHVNQDYELAQRIRDAGGRVWLDPRMRSSTLARGDLAGLARQYARYGAGRARTLRKHPHSLLARQAVPALAVGAGLLVAGLAPLSRSSRRLAGAGALAYAAAAGASARAAGAEQPALWARTLLAFPVMHLAWGLGFWGGLMAPGERRADGA